MEVSEAAELVGTCPSSASVEEVLAEMVLLAGMVLPAEESTVVQAVLLVEFHLAILHSADIHDAVVDVEILLGSSALDDCQTLDTFPVLQAVHRVGQMMAEVAEVLEVIHGMTAKMTVAFQAGTESQFPELLAGVPVWTKQRYGKGCVPNPAA